MRHSLQRKLRQTVRVSTSATRPWPSLPQTRGFSSVAALEGQSTRLWEALSDVKIGQVLKQKDVVSASLRSNIHWVQTHNTVQESVRQMARLDVGSVCVSEQGRLVGIFTERDFVRRGMHQAWKPVGELMTPAPFVVDPGLSLAEAMTLMMNHRHLPVVIWMDQTSENATYSKKDLINVLSIRDIMSPLAKAIKPFEISNHPVGEIQRGRQSLCQTEISASILQAGDLMISQKIGSLAVVDPAEKNLLCGILTERDILHATFMESKTGVPIEELEVQQLMTRNPLCVSQAYSLGQCLELFAAHRIRHLPVLSTFEEEEADGSLGCSTVVVARSVVAEILRACRPHHAEADASGFTEDPDSTS